MIHALQATDTFMEVIAIAEVEVRLEATLSRHFSTDERRRFHDRPAQTIAGQIALKTAVCRLAEEKLGASHLTPRNIDIARSPEGAPSINKVTATDRRVKTVLENHVLVSISHSRVFAVGLAVLQGSATRC